MHSKDGEVRDDVINANSIRAVVAKRLRHDTRVPSRERRREETETSALSVSDIFSE